MLLQFGYIFCGDMGIAQSNDLSLYGAQGFKAVYFFVLGQTKAAQLRRFNVGYCAAYYLVFVFVVILSMIKDITAGIVRSTPITAPI